MTASDRPAPLAAVLTVTFLASVSSGVFWAGIYFVTAARYGFSPTRNLVLGAAMGAVYMVAATSAGPLLRLLERRVSPRGALGATLGAWAMAACAPVAWPGAETVLWTAALIGSAASALSFPILESYLTAGRHGTSMRGAIGWFNVTWTPATALPLLILPLLARVDVLLTIAVSAIVNVAAVVALRALPTRPASHAGEEARVAVGREYPMLMRSVSWLLPLSYVMCSTLAPVLPHRLAAVGGAVPGSVVAATWMVARFLVLFLMWRRSFWHGRWGTLVAAAVALITGTGAVLLAPSLPLIVAGLFVFGTGMGLTYYAALYYALAVGHAAVDAGGSFEALVGLGYCVGPLLGLAAHAATGAAAGATAGVTVGIVCAVSGLTLVPAVRPYLRARKSRG